MSNHGIGKANAVHTTPEINLGNLDRTAPELLISESDKLVASGTFNSTSHNHSGVIFHDVGAIHDDIAELPLSLESTGSFSQRDIDALTITGHDVPNEFAEEGSSILSEALGGDSQKDERGLDSKDWRRSLQRKTPLDTPVD